MTIDVVGAGLAGCEAALCIARLGIGVRLWEMRPSRMTPAHRTGHFAELVCSNSLKSDVLDSAHGLLKAELRALGSHLLMIADQHRVPAGKALAVNREAFAAGVTQAVEDEPLIEVIRDEYSHIDPERLTVIASGPLTSDSLAEELSRIIGDDNLYFFDAIAPVIDAETVDLASAFWASRYSPADRDYLNCPLTETEYSAFREALVSAEIVEPRDFERKRLFEACLPVEELARRGEMTLAFGPFKPVGLIDPVSGRRPFACLQLRRETVSGTLLSLVGCQTRLKYGEQRRVFGMIPALQRASFARFGSMHRNLYVNSPIALSDHHQLKAASNVFLAGQITGLEGYVESIASGLIAGINAARRAMGQQLLLPPPGTMIGALMQHISTADAEHFQPMNSNFGLIPPDGELRSLRKRERKPAMARAALDALIKWRDAVGLCLD
ncbi:methylenetetrahydrofolate--tRNA-(uracil(54)-C(5))-methyltransferase (FADH(2)-oxidizing) TrmFO [bacterium]|nr:methylenetetrahydrofolate--tRNA-(uracil(54)-C(5))-methyltransferase (FADH(2)-oxidizing) TrmFO [bacterium]